MNYEEMSDFAINQAVTCEVFGCHDWEINSCGDFYHCGADGSGFYLQTVREYCNNPSDAWPIVLQNKITISPTSNICNDNGECVYDGAWVASSMFISDGTFYDSPCHSSVDQNPLRAAMIVFLMMKEAKCQKS